MRRVLLLGLLVLLPNVCLADSFYGEVFNSLLEDYLSELDGFRSSVSEAATRLFWIMCSISIVMSGISLIFRGDDLQSFFGFVVRYVLIIGVFLFLIENNFKICSAILDSALSIGWSGYTASQVPTQILFTTSDIAQKMYSKLSLGSVSLVAGIVMAIAILIFILVMFFCVIRFTTIFITGYLMCVVGVLAVGFAPYSETRYIALNYVRGIVATGFKLFTAAMIIQCAHNFMETLLDTIEQRERIDDFRDVYAVLFSAFFSYGLMKFVPEEIAAIFSGAGGGGQGANLNVPSTVRAGAALTARVLNNLGSPRRPRPGSGSK